MAETEQALRPSTSKPEREMSGWWVLLGIPAGVLIAFGAVWFYRDNDSISTRHESCEEALDAAERVIDAAAAGFGLTQQAFDAISDFDLDRLEDIGNQIGDAAGDARALRDDYDDKAEECRG